MEIARRDILGGLFVSIAAPFVIRTPGLLMPVRDRFLLSADELAFQTRWGMRDYQKYPPTVAEVKAWRRSTNEAIDAGIHHSWNAAGFNKIIAMGEAEDRYRAMGLL